MAYPVLDKNVGEGLGRKLMSKTQGGLYERFFEEVGKPVDLEAGALICKDQPDVGRIAETASEHGIEIPAP